MAEIKRVLLGRKSLILAGILILLHAVFFYYQCNEMKTDTLTDEDLEVYVDTYQDYLKGVTVSADEMAENPLFASGNSFVCKNILKTKQDYESLFGITPVYGENRGIMTMIPYQLTGYLLLLIGIYYVLSFMAERQKGLYLLVRCTYNGRIPLSLSRVCTLILGLTACGSLFYLTILPIVLIRFPGSALGRPIQSIPEFSGFPQHVSIAGYLFLFVLRRILGCLVTCMLLYFCMSLLRSSLCVLLFLALFFGEYLLYALLLPTDQLCVLKYVNLYTQIFAPQEYARYLNVNFFGSPVLSVTLSDYVALLTFAILALLCFLQYARQYPKAEGRSFRWADRIRAWQSLHKPQLTPFLWECKKILISQKALFIFLAFFYLAWSSSREISYRDYRSKYVLKWYQTYEGALTEAKLTEMEKQQKKLEEKQELFEKSLERQQEILIKYTEKGYDTSTVSYNVMRLKQSIREVKQNLRGLQTVRDHAISDYEFTQKTGIDVELMDPTFYELLLHKDFQTVRKNYLYVLLSVILMFSGVMSCETSSNMSPSLHVLYRGGREMIVRKVMIVMVFSVTDALFIHLIQYWQILSIVPPNGQNVIAQSIPCIRYLPIVMHVRTYLVLLYALRALIAFAFGLAVMLISRKSKSRTSTIALSTFLLGIPMVLLSYFFLYAKG